jgi:hypothetical protein
VSWLGLSAAGTRAAPAGARGPALTMTAGADRRPAPLGHHGDRTDSFTGQRRALAAVYQEVTRQAQVLSFADDFGVLFLLSCSTLLLRPLLQRVHAGGVASGGPRHDDAPAPVARE